MSAASLDATAPASAMAPSSYAQQSAWTDSGPHAARLAVLPAEPDRLASIVSGLLLHPASLAARDIAPPEGSRSDPTRRTVRAIVDLLLSRNDDDLAVARPPATRALSMCSSFALLAAAILRAHGVEARLRAGFATYFTSGLFVDHWVCEYRSGPGWLILDAELDDPTRAQFGIRFAAHDVPATSFMSAAGMWHAVRQGVIDPVKVGVPELGIAGAWFVAGSLLRDAAALAMQETQVWDYWGLSLDLGPHTELTRTQQGRFDALARDLSSPPSSPGAARELIARHDGVALTPRVRSFPYGAPVEVEIAA